MLVLKVLEKNSKNSSPWKNSHLNSEGWNHHSFEIISSRCGKITDQGVSGLMKGIRAMSVNGGCLEDMTLVFSGWFFFLIENLFLTCCYRCGKLTSEGLSQIWYGLQEIGSLKNVQLGLKK